MTAVIIVNYQHPLLTEQAVSSLRRCDDFSAMLVIVVDNGSSDGSLERLKRSCPDCNILDAGRNLGFSGGNNVGIRYALDHGASNILLLNDDTEVEPGFLAPLLKAVEGGRIIAAPKIVYADNPSRIWYGGGHVSRIRGGFYHESDAAKSSAPRNVTFASGCCMMIPSDFFREHGLMDERFFLYYEDAELCLRAIGAGYEIRYVPSSVIRHKLGASTGGEHSRISAYYGTRNRLAVLSFYHFPPWAFAYVMATRAIKLLLGRFGSEWRFVLIGMRDWLRLRMWENPELA